MQVNKFICLLKICNQRLYLLYQIKKLGLAKQQQLLRVLDAIIISRMTYAAAAWRGFPTAAECNANQTFRNKVKRRCIFFSDDRSIDDILSHMLMLLGGDFQPLQNAMQYKLFLIRSRDEVLFLVTEVLMTF